MVAPMAQLFYEHGWDRASEFVCKSNKPISLCDPRVPSSTKRTAISRWSLADTVVSSVAPFGLSIITYVTGLLFYGFHFPECIWPGKFDHLGASHQVSQASPARPARPPPASSSVSCPCESRTTVHILRLVCLVSRAYRTTRCTLGSMTPRCFAASLTWSILSCGTPPSSAPSCCITERCLSRTTRGMRTRVRHTTRIGQ